MPLYTKVHLYTAGAVKSLWKK